MSASNLSVLSYRELQAIAKTLGIPANIKKDTMILEISRKMPEINMMEGISSENEKDKAAATETERIETKPETPAAKMDAVTDSRASIAETSECNSPTNSSETDIRLNCDGVENENIPINGCVLNYHDDNIDKKDFKDLRLNGIATPTGKKTVFLSPELQMGNEVHWSVEDYDVKTLTSKLTSLKVDWDDETDRSTTSMMKMNFWLAKGNTPQKAARSATPNKSLR